MDRWWPDGTETGAKLWQGVAAILCAGCLLGISQNALIRNGDPKGGLAWAYTPPVLDALPDPAPAASGAASPAPLPPDMNDPLGLSAQAGAVGFDVPDVPRPLQIQAQRVKQFFDGGAATFVDARDAEEYAAGHIPGAINIPGEQAVSDPDRLEKFDAKGKPIIVYCGGGTCELSMNLGFAMMAAGQKKVLVFMGGWPEWSGAGYPVATGAAPSES